MQPAPKPGKPVAPVGIDHALLERYGRVPVPRYTSYPPANHWESTFGEPGAREAFLAAGTRAASHLRPRPVLPEALLLLRLQHARDPERVARGAIPPSARAGVDRVTSFLPARLEIVQVHLGGGTPTYLDVDQLVRLAGAIQARLPWRSGIEASIEIHPAVTSLEQIRTLGRLGFNRVSMGVQDSTSPSRSASTASSPSRRPGISFSRRGAEGS